MPVTLLYTQCTGCVRRFTLLPSYVLSMMVDKTRHTCMVTNNKLGVVS